MIFIIRPNMLCIGIFLVGLFLLQANTIVSLSIRGSSVFHNKHYKIMTMGSDNSGDSLTLTPYVPIPTAATIFPPQPTFMTAPPTMIFATTNTHLLTPSPTKSSDMPNRNGVARAIQKCSEYHDWIIKRSTFQFFIIKGTPAINKEFPHMAALGYGPANNIQWLCGGSLISERYILTAAHCLKSMEMGVVNWVKLGDNTLTSANSATSQMFSITERIAHPDYSPTSKYNDIAVLKLDRLVEFSEYVLPICLSTSPSDVNNRLIATGWGKTEANGPRSNALLKVDLEFFSYESCREAYADVSKKDLPDGVLPNKQVCAGSRMDQRDTCQGDSGGPLQINTDKLYLIGITSIGKMCGLPNVPAIYTRVLYYIPWIEQIVW